jgi:hypothetical protein
MFEVVYDTFAIQEIHGRPEEIPVERLCKSQTASLAWHINDANDLSERDDLNGRDEDYNVYMARQ